MFYIMVMYIYIYIPGAGADNPLEAKSFHKSKYSVYLPISCRFCPSNHILTIFPFKCINDLCWPCLTIGQGHPSVMIYTNFVELYCLMLHAKFQNHRSSGSGEDDF